jgi:hypothetical protein
VVVPTTLEKLTPEEELELIAGFLSRKPLAEVSFFDAVRPLIRSQARRHFPERWQDVDDVEQNALLRVCEMRETKAGQKQLCPPLWALAKRAVDAPAAMLARTKKWLPLKDWERAVPPNQETAFELKRLLKIAVSLPRGMASTMLFQAGFVAGDGPPLHEALEIDERSASRRLARAQDAVIEIAEGGEAELKDE